MSHADKLASALKLIEEHNAALDPQDEKINAAEFERKLKKAGGSTEAALRECTWEDLENCGLPRILARKVATIFRTAQVVESNYVSEKKAAELGSTEEGRIKLLNAYNPNDPKSPAAKRLADLANGKRFVVFRPGTNLVDVYASAKLLDEVMKHYPERERYEVATGKYVKVYTVGESLGEYVDENPLYPGRPLRPDGSCDQTNRSWDGVSLTVRQLVYLAVGQTGVSIEKANDIIDMAISPEAEGKLRQRYNAASANLDEAIEAGNAPKLKVKLGASSTRPNDPFYSGHRKY